MKEVERQVLRRSHDVAGVLALYRRARRLKRLVPVRDDAGNPAVETLRISGITRVFQGFLWVRNRIYFRVFDNKWILAHIPNSERARQRRAFAQGSGITAMVLSIPLALGLLADYQRRRAEADERAAQAILDSADEVLSTLYGRYVLGNPVPGATAANSPQQGPSLLIATMLRTARQPFLEEAITSAIDRFELIEAKHKNTIIFNLVVASSYFKLGALQERMGKFAKALKSYREAVKYQLARKKSPGLRFHRGERFRWKSNGSSNSTPSGRKSFGRAWNLRFNPLAGERPARTRKSAA